MIGMFVVTDQTTPSLKWQVRTLVLCLLAIVSFSFHLVGPLDLNKVHCHYFNSLTPIDEARADTDEVLTTERDRERRPTRKISRLHVNEGANWAGRNAIARRSASLKSPVDWDPFERPISLRLRPDERVRVYNDECG